MQKTNKLGMAALLLTAADFVQAVRITKDAGTGSEFRPSEPITVAPWHNYDPHNYTNEEWQDKHHTYNKLNYTLGQKEYRPNQPQDATPWHNYDHHQSYGLTDPRLNIANLHRDNGENDVFSVNHNHDDPLNNGENSLAQAEYRPNQPQSATPWHNYDHWQSASLSDTRLNTLNMVRDSEDDWYRVNANYDNPITGESLVQKEFRPIDGTNPWHEQYANPKQSWNNHANPTRALNWIDNHHNMQDYPLARNVGVKANNTKYVAELAQEDNQAKLFNLMQLQSDPICSSAGCTQFKHAPGPPLPPRDYFVPDFGTDPEMDWTLENEAISSKALSHQWNFKTAESWEKYRNKAKDVDYNFNPDLDEDIVNSQKNQSNTAGILGGWELLQVKNDPICGSGGCDLTKFTSEQEAEKLKVAYPDPKTMKLDSDIIDSIKHESKTEKRMGRNIPLDHKASYGSEDSVSPGFASSPAQKKETEKKAPEDLKDDAEAQKASELLEGKNGTTEPKKTDNDSDSSAGKPPAEIANATAAAKE